jgi:transcriptional regulator with XRE-family HTH domain
MVYHYYDKVQFLTGEKMNKFNVKQAMHISMAVMGYNNQELGEKTGISASALSALRSGVNSNPTLETLERICKGLGIPLSQFVNYGERK